MYDKNEKIRKAKIRWTKNLINKRPVEGHLTDWGDPVEVLCPVGDAGYDFPELLSFSNALQPAIEDPPQSPEFPRFVRKHLSFLHSDPPHQGDQPAGIIAFYDLSDEAVTVVQNLVPVEVRNRYVLHDSVARNFPTEIGV